MHQHPGLATARTRQHQQVVRGTGDSITLWLVERIEYVRNIHGLFYQNVWRNPGLMWAFIVVFIRGYDYLRSLRKCQANLLEYGAWDWLLLPE